MRRQTCSCFGRVRLNGVAFIQQTFVVKLSEQPPNTLHVFRSVGNVGVLHIDPISHFFGELVPDVGVAHDGLFTSLVVGVYTDFGTDVFFGDAEFFFYAELYRQAVGIPTCFAVYLLSFEGLVTAKDIFNGAAHDVVNTGQTIGRRRPFIKDKRGSSVALCHGLLKNGFFLPFFKNGGSDIREI